MNNMVWYVVRLCMMGLSKNSMAIMNSMVCDVKM